MKNIIPVVIFILISSGNIFAQTIELTFTAEYNSQHIQTDSIYIRNLSQGSDTVLYYPDTVLYISNVGMYEFEPDNSVLSVSQNYPNPFTQQTSVNVYVSRDELISVSVFDITGRQLAGFENTLSAGNHMFSFFAGTDNYYLFSVTTPYEKKMIKMFGSGSQTNTDCRLVYNGMIDNQRAMKAVTSSFVYSQGDQLSYIGYATIAGNKGSGFIDDVPSISETYVFNIEEDGIPCPGMPTITDADGNTYPTVRIGCQCWMAENLKTTHYRDGSSINYPGSDETAWENDTIGSFAWYDNDITYKDIYGALYNGFTIENPANLCPVGWHVPSDEEWCTMENYIERGADPDCAILGELYDRGINSGRILKSCLTSAGSGVPLGCETDQHPRWYYYTNKFGFDTYGFSALPAGRRSVLPLIGPFAEVGFDGYWWTTDLYFHEDGFTMPIYRKLGWDNSFIMRNAGIYQEGYSVRCIRD